MILDDNVEITIAGFNLKYWEDKGYEVPRYLYRNKFVVKIGTKIKVKVIDLPHGSKVKILCKCGICGKEKMVIYSNLKKYHNVKYVCHRCTMNMEERNKKISESHIGMKYSDETKMKMGHRGEKNHNYGKFGSEHSHWNPKLTEKDRKKQHNVSGIGKWRNLVKERDNYKCRLCESIENLHVHHINNFSDFEEQRTLVENGITLCKKCHNNLHKKYGLKVTKLSVELK